MLRLWKSIQSQAGGTDISFASRPQRTQYHLTGTAHFKRPISFRTVCFYSLVNEILPPSTTGFRSRGSRRRALSRPTVVWFWTFAERGTIFRVWGKGTVTGTLLQSHGTTRTSWGEMVVVWVDGGLERHETRMRCGHC